MEPSPSDEEVKAKIEQLEGEVRKLLLEDVSPDKRADRDSKLQELDKRINGLRALLPSPSVMEAKHIPRPAGISIIAVLWSLAGLVNIYNAAVNLSADSALYPLPSTSQLGLNSSQIDSINWLQANIPTDMGLHTIGLFLGFAELLVVYGLWTGKSWSYRGAFIVLLVSVFDWVSTAVLYSSAPSLLNLGGGSVVIYAVASIAWLPVYVVYFRSERVKTFLGVGGTTNVVGSPPSIPPPSTGLYESPTNAIVFNTSGGSESYVLEESRVVKLEYLSGKLKALIWLGVLAVLEVIAVVFLNLVFFGGLIGILIVTVPYSLIRNKIASDRQANQSFIANISLDVPLGEVLKAEMKGVKVSLQTAKKTFKFNVPKDEKSRVGSYLQERLGDKALISK